MPETGSWACRSDRRRTAGSDTRGLNERVRPRAAAGVKEAGGRRDRALVSLSELAGQPQAEQIGDQGEALSERWRLIPLTVAGQAGASASYMEAANASGP